GGLPVGPRSRLHLTPRTHEGRGGNQPAASTRACREVFSGVWPAVRSHLEPDRRRSPREHGPGAPERRRFTLKKRRGRRQMSWLRRSAVAAASLAVAGTLVMGVAQAQQKTKIR